VIALMFSLSGSAYAGPPPSERIIYSNALDSAEAILTRSGVTLDTAISHDGKGAIRIDASGPTTIRLAEVQPKDAEGVALTYRAHLRTQNLTGRAFLEMWCSIPGKGEFFSRGLQAPVTGTTEWVSAETPFFLEKGQRAQTVKLNVVVEGAGIVWVDDIALGESAR
jgi:hypothetical protein